MKRTIVYTNKGDIRKIANIIRAVVLVGLPVAAASAAQAGVCTNPIYTTSDPNGGLGFDLDSNGTEDFYVHNHLWNAANYPGTQGTTEICNYNSWRHTAVANNNNGDGAVKTYPNTHRNYVPERALSNLPVITSTFGFTAPGSGIYNVAYDIWLNNFAYEIMIWTENHNQRPGGNIVASNLSISGYTWDFWKSGTGYIAFAAPVDPGTGRPNHRIIPSGNFDIKAFLNWLISNGHIPSSATMRQLDFGVEIVSTDNVQKVFDLIDFSITDTGSGTPPSISTQPANQTVTVGQAATFNVVASGSSPLSYQWRKNGANISGANGSSYTTPATVIGDNGALFSVVVSNPLGNVTSANATLTVTGGGGGLPSPWQTADIGAVGAAGSASHSSGTFTVVGSGADIQGTADEFRYVYQTATGNCEIKARVTGVGNTNPWAKAGVMIRETLTAGSKHTAMSVTPSSGVEFLYRTSTGGSSGQALSSGSAPLWVRVVRSNKRFTGYTSPNGVDWTSIGSININMSSSVYIGLSVTSHADGTLNTSTFDNVTATP